MGRRRIVTSVSLDPAVFENGREEGLNFSKVLEQGIIDQLEPHKQIDRLEGEILFHEKEIVKLKEEIKVLKQIDDKHIGFVYDEMIERVEPFYKEHGYIPKDVLVSFGMRMRKPVRELEEELLCQLQG